MTLNKKRRTACWKQIGMITMIILAIVSLTGMTVTAQKVGLVNLARVTASHPNTEKINQLNQELRTELQTRQETLNQEGKGLEESELVKLEEKFNTEWEPVKQKILAQMQALQAERNSDIVQAIRNVGERGSYEVIVNSEVPVFTSSGGYEEYPVVLYGGDNLTQDIIDEVNTMTAVQ